MVKKRRLKRDKTTFHKTTRPILQKKEKIPRHKTSVSTRWIFGFLAFVIIFSIGLFIYFNRKAAERRAAKSKELQDLLENEKSKVTLSCKGLLPLENGYYAIYYTNEQGTSHITNFNISPQGKLIDLSGNELQQPLHAWNASDYTLKAVSPDGKETTLMTGKPTMEVLYKNVLLQANGSFVLSTPSDSDPNNEAKGIWFGRKEGESWKPLLSLPAPPEGWRYAAWLSANDKMLLIGKFISEQGEDMNKIFYSGTGPSVPGEDFLTNLPENMQITDIRTTEKPSVWITLEPDWYNSVYPFSITILGAEVNVSTQTNSPVLMTLTLDALPYCTMTPSSWIEFQNRL